MSGDLYLPDLKAMVLDLRKRIHGSSCPVCVSGLSNDRVREDNYSTTRQLDRMVSRKRKLDQEAWFK